MDNNIHENANSSRQYTDFELLNILEENGLSTSYKNLMIFREGLANGTITLYEDDDTAEEKSSAESEKDFNKNMDFLADDEDEAIESYQKIADKVDDPKVVKELKKIETEEKAHKAFLNKVKNNKNLEYTEPLEEAEKVPAETEEKTEETSAAEEQPQASTQISLSADGSMQVVTPSKEIATDGQGNVNIAITEAMKYLSSKNTERLLKSYLTEDCGMTLTEYEAISDSTKVESVKDIVVTLFKNIEEKLNSIDTSIADRSKGDIKQLRELGTIQDAVTKLEEIIERSEYSTPEYAQAVNTVVKSILYLNQYSAAFKDAYRNKKTVLILKYESIVLSIISSLTYLISVMVDYRGGDIKIKNNISSDIKDFAPLKSLRAFIESVDSNEFKVSLRDTNTIREFYLEVPVEAMGNILEATDYLPMIINGVKNFYTTLTSDNSKLVNLLYKAAGYIVLLMSLRDLFYTLFRFKFKANDMMNCLTNFVNVNNGNGENLLNKLAQFTNKFKVDAEQASDISQKEIETENRQLMNQIKGIQASSVITNSRRDEEKDEMPPVVNNPPIGSQEPVLTDLGLDF